MSVIYKVQAEGRVHPSSSLHVSKFYPEVQRWHRDKMQKRQDLILYLANLHSLVSESKMPSGMCFLPLRLMSLRDWVQDYHVVFDYFFEVHTQGYNFGEKHEISIVTPKRLTSNSKVQKNKVDNVIRPIDKQYEHNLLYIPPARVDGVVSKVYIKRQDKDKILNALRTRNRLDLYAPVQWLLNQPVDEINFHFVRAGKLQQRDTSVWPIAAIETWPSWLREDLFGSGIDIDAAYTQFMIGHLRKAYKDSPHLIQLMFPDLIRSLDDKKAWRKELCVDVLGLPYTEDNIGVVKRLCMSLANGSKISPAILTGNHGFSITKDLIIQNVDDLSLPRLMSIGARLNRISKQYSHARKIVCMTVIGLNASRLNQKKVFCSYFEWERIARYEIWNAVNRHGIMVHDGLDGVPEEYMKDLPKLMADLNIRITRS